MEIEQQHKILVVDDEVSNIEILNSALEEDYEIFFATNGEDALTILESEPLDLVLLDVVMPGMSGYEVCKKLKSDKLTRYIPVIFISSMSKDEDETKGLEVGAIDYITKPFSLPIVKARVKNHLELKRRGDILEKLSSLDGLTGIANRRRFDEIIYIEWRRAMQNKTSISLLLMDIDYFKLYNDNHGHLAGDDCLKKIARVVKESFKRPIDLVARYGGEEFVVVAPETDTPGALLMAENLQNVVRQLNIPHPHSKIADHITLSIGISTTTIPSNDSPDELINAADKMLYRAKKNGRNQIQIAGGMPKYSFSENSFGKGQKEDVV